MSSNFLARRRSTRAGNTRADIRGLYEYVPHATLASLDTASPTTGGSTRNAQLILRALKRIFSADVVGATQALEHAVRASSDEERPFAVDLLVPFYLRRDLFNAAADRIASVRVVPRQLKAAYWASQAVVLAGLGNPGRSQRFAARAIETARQQNDAIMTARVLSRTALAAFYRGNYTDAFELALEAVRIYEIADAPWCAASTASITVTVAAGWYRDEQLGYQCARRMLQNAQLAGHEPYRRHALVNLLSIAADVHDTATLRQIRGTFRERPLSGPLDDRFPRTISDVLTAGWERRYDTAFKHLLSLKSHHLSRSELSLIEALLAIIAIGTGQIPEARKRARDAIRLSAFPEAVEPLCDHRYRDAARFTAAAACVAIGDAVRGRRSMSRHFDGDGGLARALSVDGVNPAKIPHHLRGYAEFLNQAIAASKAAQAPSGLTNAELRLLKLLPEGATLSKIAEQLGKSPKTIQHQVESIYAKLNVKNRAQAIESARGAGIL